MVAISTVCYKCAEYHPPTYFVGRRGTAQENTNALEASSTAASTTRA